MNRIIIITIITFIIFFIEALFHFNYGIQCEKKEHKIINLGFVFIHIPDKTETFNIIIILTFFSILNAVISNLFL